MIFGAPLNGEEAALSNIILNTGTLNTGGAARYVGLSESTLEKARVYGSGPSYVKLGRAVRYRPADLDRWLDARVISSTSEVA